MRTTELGRTCTTTGEMRCRYHGGSWLDDTEYLSTYTREVSMNWSIAMFVVYGLGSLCFIVGSAIGLALQLGWIE